MFDLLFWVIRPVKRVSARLRGMSVLLVVGGVVAAGCQPGQTASRQDVEHPTAVRVVSVQERTVRETVDYVGTVRPERTVRVSARVPGTAEGLTVDEGERVEAGQLLARVDAPELEAKLERVEAEVRRAKTERDYVCETFETDRNLHESGALSGAKLDRSRKRCASGREAVAAAEAKRREVKKRLDKRVERAPVDGIVLERPVEPGEHVGPGRPLYVLAGSDREVVVPVVEGDLERGIEVGTRVRLKMGGQKEVDTEVESLDATAEGPGRAVVVHVPLSEAFEAIQSGRSVDVSFVVGEAAEATPVPREALVQTEKGAAIFVVEEGVAHRRSVQSGVASGNWVAVRPKLESGQRVVVTNLDVVRNEMPVYAVDAAGGTQ